jgi:hypothetical protein
MSQVALTPPPQTQGRPPGFPWIELNPDLQGSSYLCFYYVSGFSPLPVRDVNRIKKSAGLPIADNKSDPNLETKTFGLFSTCESDMRRGVVKRRAPYLFFFGQCRTPSGRQRCVTGYYTLKWYSHGGTHAGDFCLAAESCHFVKTPIPFPSVNQHLGTNLSARNPRLMTLLSPARSRRLAELLERQEDISGDYIREIKRLEMINSQLTGGLKYVNFSRRNSFCWEDIANFPQLGHESARPRRVNQAPENSWNCDNCQTLSFSPSLLRLCPHCGSSGTLN